MVDVGPSPRIVVDDAKKELNFIDTHMSYRITTTFMNASGSNDVSEVRRRYSDFEWLYFRLQDLHSSCVIPPLPDKFNLTQLDRFDSDFVASRQAAFEKFLRRIAGHPQLKQAQEFRLFLTARSWELETFKKAHPASKVLLSKVGMQLKQLGDRAASVQATIAGVSVAPFARSADRFTPDRELAIASRDFLHELVSNLHDVTNCQTALAKSQEELSSLFTQCANNEDSARPALLACSDALSTSTNLNNDLIELLGAEILPAFHEYESFCESVKRALLSFEIPEAELYKVTAQLERSAIAVSKYEQLQEQARQKRQQLETVSEELQVELQRWRCERDADLRQVFLALADAHIRMYQTSIAKWKEAVRPIQAIFEPPKSHSSDSSDSSLPHT